jgi:exopolyphosphatase/guanosine-5'-triphosphate,3'-diphosphate pyrophosphatase
MGPIAAIDCGTNSTRLLVVDAFGDTLTREMHVTRLGEGVDNSRQLSSSAISRTISVLRGFRDVMDHHSVVDARLVATSAVRDASNGGHFLKAASEITGARAEILSGMEEGRLSYAGATAGLKPFTSGTAVVDIGGGSTELIVQHLGEIHAASMELGCVRLSERYLRHDPPQEREIARTVEEIETELDRIIASTPAFGSIHPDTRLVGLAGTVSTIAALQMGLTTYQRERVHHAVLTERTVAHWCEVLACDTSAQRAKRPGMIEGRQDVIVGGSLVLREVMARFTISLCLVSESDILDGLIFSMQPGRV